MVPGCADYNARVRQPDGFVLPHAPRDAREFPTTTGKANFTADPLERAGAPGRLLLQTLRSHDQYNTTIYGLDDRYRGVKGGRRVVFVNPDDIADLGFADGDHVDLVSEYRSAAGDLEERYAKDFTVVAYSTPAGNAAAYYPETNPLVPLDHTAIRSNTPVSKAIVIRLEAASPGVQRSEGEVPMGRVTARRKASHLNGSHVVTRPETLAVEEPMEIRLNGSAHHRHDAHARLGHRTGTGISAHRGRHRPPRRHRPRRVLSRNGEDGANTYNVLDVTLTPGVPMPDVDVTRNFYTTSSCGVCGKGSIDAVRTVSRHSRRRPERGRRRNPLRDARQAARAAQKVFASTGGLHGAALFDADHAGGPRGHRSSQRRRQDHRLGGENERIPLTGTVLLVSGRASFELTQKAVMAGIPVLAAVSAPSSLAVDLASRPGSRSWRSCAVSP